MTPDAPLLFFDSGVGGLSVLAPTRALLPAAPIVYLADSAGFPYGERSEADIADAKALAELAAIAGRHGMVEATCLRRALLLYAWLRWRGLRPVLLLGVMERGGPFQAHAWVELEGERLLPSDAGYRPFASPA